jgi:hypothetical protein
MFEHPLNDSTPELVDTHFIDPLFEGINDELDLITLNRLHNLLNHVISIRIFNALIHFGLHLVNEYIPLTGSEHLKRLLDHPASELVKG